MLNFFLKFLSGKQNGITIFCQDLYYTGKVTDFLIEILQMIAGYQVLGDHLPVKILEYVYLGNII